MNHKKRIKDERIGLILEELHPEDKVLHIGCVNHEADSSSRDNWLHKHLMKKCTNVLGLDIERDEIEKLKVQGYRVVWGDCERLNLDKRFDVIVAGELIEHLANSGNFLESLKKHLNPNGKFILTTPNAYCYWNILSIIFRGKVPVHDQHICWYDITTLTQLLRRFGFDILRTKYIPIPSSGRGRFFSLFLIKIGMEKIGASGFVLVCNYEF